MAEEDVHDVSTKLPVVSPSPPRPCNRQAQLEHRNNAADATWCSVSFMASVCLPAWDIGTGSKLDFWIIEGGLLLGPDYMDFQTRDCNLI